MQLMFQLLDGVLDYNRQVGRLPDIILLPPLSYDALYNAVSNPGTDIHMNGVLVRPSLTLSPDAAEICGVFHKIVLSITPYDSEPVSETAPSPKPPTCECGSKAPRGQNHSPWCPIFKKEF